jgi:hypothetical protein
MLSPEIPAIISQLILLPSLIYGAWYDFQSRKFPAKLWSATAPIGLFFTIVMYLLLIASAQWTLIMALLFVSAILSVTFYILAVRFGSGGDYRALWTIAIICPTIAITTTILALVFGVVQVVIMVFTKKSAPWAVSILAAFIIAMLLQLR